MSRRYYAIQHAYGGNVGDSRRGREGNHVGTCYAFPSAAERGDWVAESKVEFRSQAGFREALTMRGTRADRAAIREAIDWYTGGSL